MKQAFNPYLPFWETVPDGEPHVFGDRVYVYGSHDKRGGDEYCMEDYLVHIGGIIMAVWSKLTIRHIFSIIDRLMEQNIQDRAVPRKYTLEKMEPYHRLK